MLTLRSIFVIKGKKIRNMSKKKWTYETCMEVALTCKTKNEMRKKNHAAYGVAVKHDWLKDYDWFENGYELEGKKRKMWFYETCKEAALKCKTLKEFYTNFVGAYNTSRRNGWIDEYDWLNKGKNVFKDKIDNVYAYFFINNTVYIGRTVEPHKRDTRHQTEVTSAVYRFAQENNMAVPEMTILESGLTVEEGLEREDYYVNKYRKDGWNVLNQAKTGKRSGAIGAIGKGKWNYKTCYEEALKYKTRGEFKKNSPSAYVRARKQDWLDNYTWFDPPKTVVKWTEETCYEEALKYDNIKDFRVLSSSAYTISLKHGWCKQYTWLKRKRA